MELEVDGVRDGGRPRNFGRPKLLSLVRAANAFKWVRSLSGLRLLASLSLRTSQNSQVHVQSGERGQVR
jgi:hypothetical protein